MLSILTAAALAAQASPAAVARDPDFRCLAVTAMVLDNVSKESPEDAAGAAGVTAIFMYYLGRVDLRHPSLDFAEAFAELDRTAEFMNGFAQDAERCSSEAQERGQALQSMGRALQGEPPAASGDTG
jgi:hypothetical protein